MVGARGAVPLRVKRTWILFLRILDEQEAEGAERAEGVGAELVPGHGFESAFWRRNS